MRTYLDCYPCFLRQALAAAQLVEANEGQQKAVLNRVLDLLKQVDLASTPPETSACGLCETGREPLLCTKTRR